SISGYHMREKGCSAVQEVGFTLANAIAYVQAAIDAGLKVDEFGPRLAFFFNGHNNVFQEVAKFRAVRRMWARIMRERFAAEDPVEPFAGSYFVEALTDEIEERAQDLIDKVEELGGSVEAIPFIRAEVEESAWGYTERYRIKQDIVVGVNEYVTETIDDVETLRVDPESEREQVERLKAFKDDRDQDAVGKRLEELRDVAKGDGNLLVPIRAALAERATIGEVCGVMREEFGEYREP